VVVVVVMMMMLGAESRLVRLFDAQI